MPRWGDRIVVSHTDLGGNLDILASFRKTERLLLDVHDAPEEVTRLVAGDHRALAALLRRAVRDHPPGRPRDDTLGADLVHSAATCCSATSPT